MLSRFVLALFLLAVIGPPAHAQDHVANVIGNPSLEGPLADTGLPEGWWPFSDPPNGYQIRVVAGGHTGEKALLVEGAGKWGGTGTTTVPLGPAMRYLGRGWVKIEGDPDAKALVQVVFARAGGEYVGSVWMGEVTPAVPGWHCLSIPAHSVDFPEAELVGLSAVLNGKGKAWFDDFRLLVEDAPAPGENLLANGNMEDVVDSRPAYWILFFDPAGTGTLSASAENPQEGDHCLCLKGDAGYVVATGERYRVQPGKTFTLSGSLRSVSGGAVLKIDYNRDGEYLGSTESVHVTGGEWEERSVATEFAKFPTATHFAAGVVAAAGKVEAYFDDLCLLEK